MVVSDI